LENSEKFIADPAYSFWVNASAGTGKTTILVKRVLGLLANRVEAKKILCITYTKAAALEMKERIKKELTSWIFLNEEELIKTLISLLNRQITKDDIAYARKLFILVLETENSLNIQTIHSFCQKIIRNFAFEIGIASDFDLITEENYSEFINDIKLEIYNESFNDLILFKAFEDITLYGSEFTLNEVLKEISRKISIFTKIFKQFSYIELNNNLKTKLKITAIDILAINTNFIKHAPDFKYIHDVLSIGSKTDQNKGCFLKHWDLLEPNEKAKVLQDYLEIFLTKENDPRKNIVSATTKQLMPDIESILLSEQERVLEFIAELNNFKLWKFSAALTTVASYFTNSFNKIKKDKNLLDYNDLIYYTQNLFINHSAKDFVLYKIDNRLDHILIDEAQDTSPEQWDIITKLTEDYFSGESYESLKSLFVVGDEKQSIYSFQGADHSFYYSAYNYFKQKILSSNRKLIELNLNHSYRSSSLVLKLVDIIFNQQTIKTRVSAKQVVIRHISMRGNDFGKIEILPCIENNDSAAQTLATNIAQKVKLILDSKYIIDGYNITPRDIMIIVKTRDEFYYKLIDECNHLNIPINGLDRINLNDYIAIEDLILIIKFALFPEDDLNLASLLKSPLFNISEEHLLELCAHRKNSVWQEIQMMSDNEAFSEIYTTLSIILEKNYIKPTEFLNFILNNFKAKEKFISRFGVEFINFFNSFWELVLQFEQDNIPSLHIFFEWFSKSTHQAKKTFSPEEDKVQILTTHGAKGLQAKIVILPDTTKMFSSKADALLEFSENILYWNGDNKYQNDFITAKKLITKEQKYDEYLRLLYVALTRAENYLIIAGFTNSKLSKNCWYSLIVDAVMSLDPHINSENIITVDKYKKPTL